MNRQLLLHPQTKRQLDRLLANPPHALLITGELGTGKGTIARHFVEQLLAISDASQSSHVQLFPDDGQNLPIESIRQLQHFLQLKVPGSGAVRRAIIIGNAARLSKESQNTLLKTLEEPPTDTIIILTANRTDDILPTISSRTQLLTVKPVSLEAATDYFSDKPAQLVLKHYHLSGGCVGLLTALLEDQDDHPLVQQVQYAKKVLQAPAFERLTLAESFSKDKASLSSLLWALQRVSGAALQQAGKAENHRLTQRWRHTLQKLIKAEDEWRGGPQAKLLLTDLLLNLS